MDHGPFIGVPTAHGTTYVRVGNIAAIYDTEGGAGIVCYEQVEPIHTTWTAAVVHDAITYLLDPRVRARRTITIPDHYSRENADAIRQFVEYFPPDAVIAAVNRVLLGGKP